ncbi:hypothetical protein PybrP1_010245, partial [[Pythium] brassicae (nom. inval.)]
MNERSCETPERLMKPYGKCDGNQDTCALFSGIPVKRKVRKAICVLDLTIQCPPSGRYLTESTTEAIVDNLAPHTSYVCELAAVNLHGMS